MNIKYKYIKMKLIIKYISYMEQHLVNKYRFYLKYFLN